METKYVVKKRKRGTYQNPYKRGGRGVRYDPWEMVNKFTEKEEAEACAHEIPWSLYDVGIFVRGKRLGKVSDYTKKVVWREETGRVFGLGH